MMGAHHAACGAAAWVVVASDWMHLPVDSLREHATWIPAWVPDTIPLSMGLIDTGPLGILTGAILCAGAALVADADHHNATIAHSLPPISNIMCRAIGSAAGGHRHGTHSIIGIAFFTLIAWLASFWVIELENGLSIHAGAGVLAVLLCSFAVKALKFVPDSAKRSPWAVGLALGAFIALASPEQHWWFPLAMLIGVAVHIAGDMLTTGGCNLAWPLVIKPPKALHQVPLITKELKVGKTTVVGAMWQKNGYGGFPILGNAGSWREWVLLIPISAYAIIGMVVALTMSGQEAMTSATQILEGLR